MASMAAPPTPAQQLLISRLTRLLWRIEQLDQEFKSEPLPELDALRVYGNLHSTYLTGYRELLGKAAPKPEPPAAPSLAEMFEGVGDAA